jgi:hypothetical protein
MIRGIVDDDGERCLLPAKLGKSEHKFREKFLRLIG